MSTVNIKPKQLDIVAKKNDKYWLVFNNKNTTTGALENFTCTFKFSGKKKNKVGSNDFDFTGSPNLIVSGSQLQIKMDTILQKEAGDYIIELRKIENGVDVCIAAGILTIQDAIS